MDNFDFNSMFPQWKPDNPMAMIQQALVIGADHTRVLYNQHIDNGFSEEQAMTLVLALQHEIAQVIPPMLEAMVKNHRGDG